VVGLGRPWLVFGALLLAFIIVPFILFGAAIEAFIGEQLGHPHAPWVGAGLTALTMASDVLLPVPSSLLGVGAGAALGWPLATLALAAGATLGCLLGYALGRAAGAVGLDRYVSGADRETLERYFERRGAATIVLLRAVPVLAEASVIAAGAAKMAMGPFVLASVFANVLLAGIYAYAGDWSTQVGNPAVAIAVGLVLPGVALFLRPRRGR